MGKDLTTSNLSLRSGALSEAKNVQSGKETLQGTQGTKGKTGPRDSAE